MTAPLPASSSETTKIETAPRTWFIYPLAIACTAAVLFAPTHSNAQTPKLRPDQERAIEAMLQDVEPAMRPMARQQLSASFANFSEAQIAMMMAKMKENKAATAKAPKPVVEVETPSTPEDFAFMKAQYEPVIRKHHAAQKEFDAFANEKMKAYCPGRDQYARFGSGWRYEQGEFMMESSLASWNVETNVTVAGEAYVPKNGRYKFDFSKVRMSFDKAQVDTAIKASCDKVHEAGKKFLAKVDPMLAKKDWDGAFLAEGSAQGALEPIRTELKAKFDKLSPGDFSAIQMAMMNGTKVK